jgi:hypothetical protein
MVKRLHAGRAAHEPRGVRAGADRIRLAASSLERDFCRRKVTKNFVMVPLTFFHELSPNVVGEINSALPT